MNLFRFFTSMVIPALPVVLLNIWVLIFTISFFKKRKIFGLKMILIGNIGMLVTQVLSWYGNYYFYFSDNSHELRAFLTFYSIFRTVTYFAIRAIFVIGIYKTIQELMNISEDEDNFLIRN